ncbi:non-ribosomal peptide synthetase, partial [Streptomyces colonosanans]|uniref:non-ribosomal peptide synthetase n=1 Tax=Streptomyces colonosanans TaxID=1428652 RepID=UPI0015A5D0F6
MIPLSYSQLRLWFLNRFEGAEASTYNMPIALRLTGDLDRDALAEAMRDVIGRHESLRTIFPESADGTPHQDIIQIAEVQLELDVVEVSEEELPAALAGATSRGFDLTTELPIRARLLALDARTHVLVVVLHHIAGDGWSMAPLARDVATAYAARCEGTAPQWATLPVQYADYALWQRELLGDESDPESLLSRQTSFWAKTLADLPEQLELPFDRPRPAVASFRGESIWFEIDADLHRRIVELARESRASVFMVVQAAFAALLSRLGAGTDIPIGTPVAGRTDEALEELVGFFVNTLVLRTDLSGNPTFRELIDRVRETDLAAFAHQDVPFEHLVEVINPARSMSRHPLFQVMLTFQNNEQADLNLSNVSVSADLAPAQTARFDLCLYVTEQHEDDGSHPGLRGELEFATDLFDRSTAEQLSARFTRFLAGVVAAPDLAVGRVELLSVDERQLLLHEWNDTEVEVAGASLPELFEGQVRRTAHASAVVYDDVELSYEELNAQANRLARLLIGLGVGPERVVALAMPRSVEQVVAVYAVVKAGAAYLPVDPEYPADRIAYMLNDAQPVCVLTSLETMDALPSLPESLSTIAVDDPKLAAELSSLPSADVSDADRVGVLRVAHPAYVIYTSGSTGRPKGVMVSHAAIVNRLAWMQACHPQGAGDRILQKTPTGFDVSVWEFFWPLQVGATLVVAKPGGHRDPAYLAELIDKQQVTTLQFVPSMLAVFLAEPAAAKCSSLHTVILGGEALPLDLAEKFEARLDAGLYNLYGPTEATIDVTRWAYLSEPHATSVPIGAPVWNTCTYVLDAALQPVPVNVPGELYVSGVQLARGYLGRAGLTAERFVADPFTPGERMYRTGDLVRWRADGNIEFLGRTDFQVKIRGFRVELGEIEAVITKHPEVAQGVVTAVAHQGDNRLVAYVVPVRGTTRDARALRAFVGESLPEFMVPSVVMFLDELPVTVNGKLDRKALPAPDFSSVVSDRGPCTPQQKILCQIFAEALSLERVGIDDSFFDLGGHSLLATRVVSRIRTLLGVELPVRALFEMPSVALLGERLVDAEGARAPLVPVVRPEVVPLSFAQRRLWFLNRLEGTEASTYNIPIALRLTGVLDREALTAALVDVMGRHESLRTVFPEAADGIPYQRLLDVADVRLELDVVKVSDDELPAALAAATSQGFDLTVDAPIRARLFSLADNVHVLVVVLHHVAGDGWSMAPLARDVATAYATRKSGSVPEWSPLPVQYADYALWQRELLGDATNPESVLSRQVAYWTEALAGVPEQLELPFDRPRPAVASFRGESIWFEIDADLHRRIVELARESRASVFMVVQAAFAALLSRLGAGTDIPIGTPVAGRTDEALKELVGFFVNTLVLRTDLSGNPTFRELIDRVRETDLAAFAHQDVPFEHLVEVINPARSMSRHPLFQVMLTFQNNEQADFQLQDLSFTEEAVPLGAAKFDLALNVSEILDKDGLAQGLTGSLGYSVQLFDRRTIESFVLHFERLLRAMTDCPSMPVDEWEILTAEDRDRILLQWNSTELKVPYCSFAAAFERQVACTPNATALVAGDESVSFELLNARANRLARLLAGRGVGPEQVVALVLPRSTDMVVSILAVLKAGAAYLPIDPDYPEERLRYLFENSLPVCVVTVGRLVGVGPDHFPRIFLDDADVVEGLRSKAADDLSDEDRVAPLLPSHPAYVIYTSGSTGRPKGVVIENRSLVNLVHSHRTEVFGRQTAEAGRQLRVAFTASFSFDGSWGGLLMMMQGHELHLVSENVRRSSQELADYFVQRRIDVLHGTPSFVQPLVASGLIDETVGTYRPSTLMLGGEEVEPSLWELLRSAPGVEAFNFYGPTEFTLRASFCQMANGDRSSIGRPVANSR